MDYDEFGNYIGADVDSNSESETESTHDQSLVAKTPLDSALVETSSQNGARDQVVLYEDKVYHEPIEEVFDDDVEILHYENDTQAIDQPIVDPQITKTFVLDDTELPPVNFSRQFQVELLKRPDHIRNIAIVGHRNHGKTSLVDSLVALSHELDGKDSSHYTHTHIIEQRRKMSVKSTPLSLIVQDSEEKSFVFNVVDTPGHTDFADELGIGLRLVDGIVLVVDVIEGLMPTTRIALKEAALQKKPVVLVLNKMDRLMLDLRLTSSDAFLRLEFLLDEINAFASSLGLLEFNPVRDNVIFASTEFKWSFTLKSYASMYADEYNCDPELFKRRLWGDIFYNRGRFERTGTTRTFNYFILDPIFKLYASVLSESKEDLERTLDSLYITLDKKAYKKNPRDILLEVCSLFFGSWSGFVDSILETVPGPGEAMVDTIFPEAISDTNKFIGNVVKLVPDATGSNVFALARVFSGKVSVGDRILVTVDSHHDIHEQQEATVEALWIPQGRYRVPIETAVTGNIILIAGIDSIISNSATLGSSRIFTPINYLSQSVVKLGIEPLKPSELPKLLDGLRIITRIHGSLNVTTEQSGEHIIEGPGELYLDCVMLELREIYAKMEIKVSDPAVRFKETCTEESYIALPASTPNGGNKITILSKPLTSEVIEDVRELEPGSKQLRTVLKTHGWDNMAAASLWAFGPETNGYNILLDDTLTADKTSLNDTKESIVEGFKWSTSAGPLCEEPMRNVQFKIMDTMLSANPVLRSSGQITPTVRRACHSAFLVAGPRLMEPVYLCTAVGPISSGRAVYEGLHKRRGKVLSDRPIPGTPLYIIEGILPTIDSFGFETDVRLAAQGQVTISLTLHEWANVPGDPLDTSIKLGQLDTAQGDQLARNFVLKTRKRKGLGPEPVLSRYLDPEVAALVT